MNIRLCLAASLALSLGACAESVDHVNEDATADVFESVTSALGTESVDPNVCDAVSSFALTPENLAITGDVTTGSGSFTVNIDSYHAQELEEVRLWFGAPGELPLVGGAPDFDAYPVVDAVNGTSYSATFDQPVSVACGEELKVAIYVLANDGYATDEYKMYIYIGTCCDTDVEEGCTYTQGYWKNHNQYARGRRGTAWPISEDTQMCGESWLDILRTPTRGDAWMILAHQWIAASLNDTTASTTAEVADALAVGADLLAGCEIADGDRALAIGASEILDAYNNGVVGPGHCD